MEATTVVATISATTALAVAALSYSFNKRREREAEWRQLKLTHYKEYVSALSDVVGQRSTPASQARYSAAANFMTLVASPVVLRTLYAFQDEIRISNPDRTAEKHDATLSALLREIRRDVHPQPPDDAGLTFGYSTGRHLTRRPDAGWASSVRSPRCYDRRVAPGELASHPHLANRARGVGNDRVAHVLSCRRATHAGTERRQGSMISSKMQINVCAMS